MSKHREIRDCLRVTSGAVEPESVRLTDSLLALMDPTQLERLPRLGYELPSGANLLALLTDVDDVRLAKGDVLK